MALDPVFLDSRVQQAATQLPFSSLFVTVSGAHLYGFASPEETKSAA